jgi:dTMP kinase
MATRGKLIAIEGIDGSGKRTQLDLLSKALAQRGVPLYCISFPRYQSSFGQLVARYLNGDFGPLNAVDPHLSAVLFSGDRFEARPQLESELAAGRTVLADRYIASNLAHQTARLATAQQEEFLAWLRHIEYDIYGLPREDLVLYLRLPASHAHELVARKAARDYTHLRRDIQEADVRHLECATAVYDRLARQPHWLTVECLDTSRGALRPAEEIAREVLAAVSALLGIESKSRGSAP